MALPIRKIATKPVVPAKVMTTAPEAPRRRKQGSVDGQTVTVRMPPNHMEMITAAMEITETDRSELIKRAVRLLHTALQSHDAELILRDRSGKQSILPIMSGGVPV